MRIDTHVHCRDGNEREKATISGVVKAARDAGIDVVFDMPNTINPATGTPTIRKVDIEARLELAKSQGVLDSYKIYVGATPDSAQLEEAANIVCDNSRVPGIKAFMGKSVGNLEIIDVEKQKNVYKKLSDCGYEDVIALHCEKESEMMNDLFNPANPVSHCYARPLKAEIESFKDQIEFAREADFEGTILGCHVSSTYSIELLKNANKDYGLKVAAEITPHHALLSKDDMKLLGMIGKMNPPLREKEEQKKLFSVLQNETDIPIILATDYAPHKLLEKIRKPFLSGISNYTLYTDVIKMLDGKRVEDLTYGNIVEIFGEKKCGV